MYPYYLLSAYMVCFDYMHYNTNGELKIINHSPIVIELRFLICQEDGPYIVFTGGIYRVMHYRIDKIANLRITSCSSSKYTFPNMDATTYAHKKCFMFSDDNLNVTFRFRASILDYMIELFDADIILIQRSNDDIETTVSINKTGALLLAQQYSDALEIIYPQSLIQDMRDRITNLGGRYGMHVSD